MQKREAKITAQLRKYITETGIHLGSCAIEMKVAVGKSLPFNAVKEHQLQALKNSRGTFVWKIADDSVGVKPFDLFVLQNAQGYVGVCFYVPRQPPTVYLIPVDGWIRLSSSSERKSLTEQALLESKERCLKIVLRTSDPSPTPV